MPKTEKALKKLVLEQNITRTHHRSLNDEYGYNHILYADLVDECVKLYEQKKSKIRVLDIGCGDGLALSELRGEIEEKGLGDRFEFFGMGMNVYKKMYIPRDRFIKKGAYSYKPQKKRFDLVISVYTFQYMWHKLEILEHIYNSFMSDGAKAIIHFPGYLVKFSEASSGILQSEAEGNKSFKEFIEQWNASDQGPKFKHLLVPYYSSFDSDDDEQGVLTEFGNLRFERKAETTLDFNVSLSGFGIYDEGFIFGNLDKKLSYVSSIYRNKPGLMLASAGRREAQDRMHPARNPAICRIVTLKREYQQKTYPLHLGIHSARSNNIVGIYPAAKEEMTGIPIPYREIADALLKKGAGAVVRCNGLYDRSVDFQKFNDFFIRRFIEYILNNAKSICGSQKPKIYLMGYSSGASAIASVAAEYAAVEKVLLLAPSYDSGKAAIEEGLKDYRGELYVVAAGQDEIIDPYQVAWFYYFAPRAKVRKYVQLDSCDHNFTGARNQEAIAKAPFWAFKRSKDFPRGHVPAYEEEFGWK